MKTSFSAQELRDVIYYDPNTGIFRWTKTRGRAHKGKTAGCKDTRGYLMLRVFGSAYLVHRLAWFYMTGRWPVDQIDHIDRDRTNNRFENLREATNSQNKINCGLQSNNASGFKGVSWRRQCNRWGAQIGAHGKLHYLGLFDSAEEAAEAYVRAAKRFHGEFAEAR